ncbi:phytanoyl-CoA dioxygenase family protein [Pokkaliibacter sp. MBI-7]|uniref:phytanoyl-CoA dioxygenase family protein n=1 Tax=Pokkaliibacter sp. MBI-7 TaxID=3040600 RepID=UPI00244C36DF|nr:phytanoyl-CoA dioxygenase family protein [Pokkaliibacter sp. MBI-7]MDH2431285.1 phytanoyl-CoA dioxygenase family protein [Pokkaliibacter sp. MBI-7]
MAYLSDKQREQFQRDGVLVVPQFYPLEQVHQVQWGIYQIIGQVMLRHGVEDTRDAFSPDTFDQVFIELIQRNRAWGGEIYDAVKQIPAFLRLVAHPAHEELFNELRENAIPGMAAGGYGIRIDIPFEDKYRAMWHQEYPAQLRSVDGLVFWSPLVAITEALGPVAFCPGSHRRGILPVYQTDPQGTGRSGAYALRIRDEADVLTHYPQVAPLTAPGDLVIIDFAVMHCSGFNISNRARWSMQFRYFNFADPVGRSHGWKGSYAAGVDFTTIHPELFCSESPDEV